MKKILLFFLIFPYIIQAGTTGKLTGKVTDKITQEPLPFVNIIVEGTTLGAASDIDGNYVILNIPPGKYTIRVQYIGYQTISMQNVVISVDLTTMRNFEISPAAVELSTITIQGTVERIQKDVTSSQSSVSTDQIQNLPVAELEDVVKLQSGVTTDASGGFHIRGGRTTEIAYWVNGISITDPFDNSQGIRIDNSSVQELQVISGTFNAEYGNAMSGIVNTVTKEGGQAYKGDIQVYSSDHLSNFTDYFPHIDKFNPFSSFNFQGSVSGPVPFTGDKLKFFLSARSGYDDGYLYGERRYKTTGEPGDRKVVSMNWNRRAVGQGNLSYWITNDIKVNDEFLFSREKGAAGDDNNGYTYKWAPDGWPTYLTKSYINTFTLTHMLSSKTFYTLKGAYFFKDVNTRLYESPYDSRYLHPDLLNILGYAYRTKGTNLHRYYRGTSTISGKFDFTSQVNLNHLLKFGAEAKFHDLKLDDYNLIPLKVGGVEVSPFVPDIPLESSSTRTKYERKPVEFSGYLEDKIEYESVIINIGLRLDYFDAKGKVPVDYSDPNPYVALRSEYKNMSVAERESYYYKNSKAKWQLSPRFGIAYPVSANGVVHFSYGHFLQIPNFDYLYKNGQFLVPETGSNYGPYGNPDLEAQKTVMYEIGFRQEFFGGFLADVTGFYRDVRNWITAGPLQYTSNLVSYSVYINKDYSNVKGITLTLSKRFSANYSIDINYTYQAAEGSNSTPEDEFNAAKDNKEPALYLLPMDWDQTHLLNANLFIGGESWGASITGRYGTGLPYTPSITQYTSDRGISSGLQRNSRRRPEQFTVDLKLDKSFNFMNIDMTAFVRVFNLLDAKVAVNVFGDSGKPNYTTEGQNVGEDPSRPNTVAEYLKYPWYYGEPRSVQFGMEFSF